MPNSTATTCAQCGAPLPSSGPADTPSTTAVFDVSNSNSPAFCSAACIEKARQAPIVITPWGG